MDGLVTSRPVPVCRSFCWVGYKKDLMSATNGKDWPSVPLYPVTDAARFAHVPAVNLRRWVEGYEVEGSRYPPLLAVPGDRPYDETALSFENLIEANLVGWWRKRGVPLQRIRQAYTLGEKEFGPHPFARKQIYVSGRDLFVEVDEATRDQGGRLFTALTKGGQRALGEALERYLHSIDWQTGTGRPYQWRPLEGGNSVRLNPQIEFGLPNVRRIRTETVLQRFLADESVDDIADDLGLEVPEVEHALRYEWALPKAA
jgi:uncharacterized protein (DUF433 family)